MAEKRYYWLKLQEDFFSSVRIKRLRKIAGGDTYTIIYLKMQLLSIRNGGMLKYSGYEPSFAEELAIDIDEEPENVAVTLQYLSKCGLIETSDHIDYLLPFAAMNIGSEGSGAKRVRDFRERQKALQSNASVTEVKQIGNVEIEKEIEKEKDIDSSYEESCREAVASDSPNGKNSKGKNEKRFAETDKPYRAAKWLSRAIMERMPKRKPITEDDLQRWASDIDKLHRIDGYDDETISDVLIFSQRDAFWQSNILSGKKFREKFVTLMAHMERDARKQSDD